MIKVQRLFPFETDRCKVRVIGLEDIGWYVDKLRQPFFNEFVDVKASDSSVNELSARLTALIAMYKINMVCKNEVRAVITMGNVTVGGLTVFNSEETGVYDLGYWIVPQYQGKGIALEILKKITNKLECNIKGIKMVRLVIHEDNYKSIGLAEKAGYKFVTEYQGKLKKNLVYGSVPLRF